MNLFKKKDVDEKLGVARVLFACIILGVDVKANELIELPQFEITLLKAEGIVDDSAEAIEYCKKELNAEVKTIIRAEEKAE
jgi:hypothetical protein